MTPKTWGFSLLLCRGWHSGSPLGFYWYFPSWEGCEYLIFFPSWSLLTSCWGEVASLLLGSSESLDSSSGFVRDHHSEEEEHLITARWMWSPGSPHGIHCHHRGNSGSYHPMGMKVLTPYSAFSNTSLWEIGATTLLAGVKVQAPFLGFTGAGEGGTTVFSVVFGWSEVVLVSKFSVLLNCFLPGSLARMSIFWGSFFFLFFFLSLLVSISGLPTSLTLSLGYMEQEKKLRNLITSFFGSLPDLLFFSLSFSFI